MAPDSRSAQIDHFGAVGNAELESVVGDPAVLLHLAKLETRAILEQVDHDRLAQLMRLGIDPELERCEFRFVSCDPVDLGEDAMAVLVETDR